MIQAFVVVVVVVVVVCIVAVVLSLLSSLLSWTVQQHYSENIKIVNHIICRV